MNEKKYSDWKWKGRNLERRLLIQKKGEYEKEGFDEQKKAMILSTLAMPTWYFQQPV